jgi:hypothetical protein
MRLSTIGQFIDKLGPSIHYELVAWSGRGVVRNCCDNDLAPALNMTSLWKRSLANDAGSTMWNPKRSRSEHFVIWLGANDAMKNPLVSFSLFNQSYNAIIDEILSSHGCVKVRCLL